MLLVVNVWMSTLLSFGLPKGSLEEATLKLFARAGFNITKGSRSYTPSWDDADLGGRFGRAQEMWKVFLPIPIVQQSPRVGYPYLLCTQVRFFPVGGTPPGQKTPKYHRV